MMRNNQPVRNGANKWDPLLGNLPFLLIVAICPLVMFFMMTACRGFESCRGTNTFRFMTFLRAI